MPECLRLQLQITFSSTNSFDDRLIIPTVASGLWRASPAVIHGNRKGGKNPHGNKHLATAKQNSPSKTKCFNGLVYLVLHAAEASLEIVGERACFAL
jgi:hypothetical protein